MILQRRGPAKVSLRLEDLMYFTCRMFIKVTKELVSVYNVHSEDILISYLSLLVSYSIEI
jgi:hypothetical protein